MLAVPNVNTGYNIPINTRIVPSISTTELNNGTSEGVECCNAKQESYCFSE